MGCSPWDGKESDISHLILKKIKLSQIVKNIKTLKNKQNVIINKLLF